jgi:hypothetical protein
MVRVMVILAVAVMAVYGAAVVYAQQRPQIIGWKPSNNNTNPWHTNVESLRAKQHDW